MLEVKEVENGLLLSIPDLEDRQELAERLNKIGEIDTWWELFEPFQANGRFYPVNPDCTFVGLTSDPYLITNDLDIDDDGSQEVKGDLYYCPEYAVISVIEQLVNHGQYTLAKL